VGTRPSYQALVLLQITYVVAPIVAGMDKFFDVLVNWDAYLWPRVTQIVHIGPHLFMQIVGVIEMVAGVIVAISPRVGGWIVGLWLWGIVANLLLCDRYYDIALRDFGLSLGAFALARLAQARHYSSSTTR
jgi:hypothetical protein